MRFRKRAAEIEAVQWFKAGDHPQVKFWTARANTMANRGKPFIETAAGQVNVWPGDWIVTDEHGTRVVPPDVFAATYEPVP